VIPRAVYKRTRIPSRNPVEEILSEGISSSSQIGLIVRQRLGKLVVVKVFPSLLFSLIVIVLEPLLLAKTFAVFIRVSVSNPEIYHRRRI